MDIVLRLRRLIRMSMTIRNLAFSQAYRVNVPRLFSISHFLKDKVNQSESKHCKEDLMLKILQQGLSPSKLLNYIDSNRDQIKGKHVLAALASIHNFYQGKPQPDLHEHIDFTKLCTSLESQIKQLTPNEAFEAMNMLHFFNVPSTNVFITTLLHHIRESMEKLSIPDIYKLSVLIEKLFPTSLNESIKSELQYHFSKKILELNKNDINASIYGLCFASKNIQNEAILKYLFEIVQNYGKELKLEQVLETFLTLCSIQELPNVLKNMIQPLQMLLLEKIDDLNPHQFLQIIEGISSQINMKCNEFYNEAFIDNIIQKVISENWNFEQASNILSCLNLIRHVQMDLLDYMSAISYENPAVLQTDLNLLQPLVTGLALADYKPVFWDVMREPILSNEIDNSEHLKLCYFNLYLACLECFEPVLLQEVFSIKFIISEEQQHLLLRLYQIVKILYPSYNGPWPSKDLLNSFKNLQKNENDYYPLLTAIEQAVGGNIYVKTNVRTTLEHFIDHVVIMNKSGYPIAVNSQQSINSENYNDITYLEDLFIPPGSQIFLILYAEPEWYARNTCRMLGPYSLYIKTLESMSYTVIPINGKMWQKMAEKEKTSYVMQAIKLKFEDNTISTTS